MEHTKGPWYVKEPTNVICATLEGVNDIPIATVDTFQTEWKANASLIATAPELLEACKKAIHFFDYEIPINAGEELNRILMELKTAISKAEAKP